MHLFPPTTPTPLSPPFYVSSLPNSPVQDDSAVLVKLPSYEECIKTDGYITVDIVDTKHNKEGEEDKQGGESKVLFYISFRYIKNK